MKTLCFTLLFCFATVLLFAQNNDEFMVFRTANSLLPSDKIYDIAIDSNNVKWIATAKGLASFDGTNWQVFNKNNGLLSNKVTAVAIDKSNTVWIIDSVLSRYTGSEWVHYTPDKYANAAINSYTLAIDENSVKWMATEDSQYYKSICSFNDTTFSIYDWGHLYDWENNIKIRTYKNEKWIYVHSTTLWRYDDNKLINPYYDSLYNWRTKGLIDAFNIGPNGKILLSTHTTFGNPDSWIEYFHRYEMIGPNEYYEINGLPDDYIYAVAFEGDSVKWFGTSYSLYKIKDGQISSFRHDFDLSTLGTIVIDQLGNKWLAAHYNWYSNGISVYKEGGVILTSVNDKPQYLPDGFKLEQNYPNPFNPTTKISYSIPSQGMVSLIVYDILGNEIAVIVKGIKPAGSYEVEFNGGNLSSGIYFCRMQAGDFVSTRKLVLMK